MAKPQDGWLGLEMTTGRKRHIGEGGIPDVRDHPAPVISSGGIILHENTVKIATASRSREIFLVVGNTGLFNAFHLSRFAANAPPQPSAAHPTGKRLTTICALLRSFKSCSLPPRWGSQVLTAQSGP